MYHNTCIRVSKVFNMFYSSFYICDPTPVVSLNVSLWSPLIFTTFALIVVLSAVVEETSFGSLFRCWWITCPDLLLLHFSHLHEQSEFCSLQLLLLQPPNIRFLLDVNSNTSEIDDLSTPSSSLSFLLMPVIGSLRVFASVKFLSVRASLI